MNDIMTDEKFNFGEVLNAIHSGQIIKGVDDFLAPLVKQFTEAALDAESETYFAEKPSENNRKNSYSKRL